MEFMPGAPIKMTAFQSLGDKTKKDMLEQVARVFKLLQQYQLPASVKGYGGLGFADDGSIAVGPTPVHGAVERCETYHELYRQ